MLVSLVASDSEAAALEALCILQSMCWAIWSSLSLDIQLCWKGTLTVDYGRESFRHLEKQITSNVYYTAPWNKCWFNRARVDSTAFACFMICCYGFTWIAQMNKWDFFVFLVMETCAMIIGASVTINRTSLRLFCPFKIFSRIILSLLV